MKVIKRNGNSVDFDQTKIETAISKANTEVKPSERASKEDIQAIIEYILSLGKKRMLVEDIQDEIEAKLMSQSHYELAKNISFIDIIVHLLEKQTPQTKQLCHSLKTKTKMLLKKILIKMQWLQALKETLSLVKLAET